ncbi:MAG: TlpA family protein disulfide reductase [Bryobacteraceae bacterium]
MLRAALAPALLAAAAAQTLSLPDLTGKVQTIEQYRGQVVVLNFWATWCVPCRAEMPMLRDLHAKYQSHGLAVIGASGDDESTRQNIQPFIEKLKVTFPVWTGASTGHMRELELGAELPATAVIDREGRIVGRIIGEIKRKDLEYRIQHALGLKTGAPPPLLVDNSRDAHGGENHQHGSVAVEGASSVPS